MVNRKRIPPGEDIIEDRQYVATGAQVEDTLYRIIGRIEPNKRYDFRIELREK